MYELIVSLLLLAIGYVALVLWVNTIVFVKKDNSKSTVNTNNITGAQLIRQCIFFDSLIRKDKNIKMMSVWRAVHNYDQNCKYLKTAPNVTTAWSNGVPTKFTKYGGKGKGCYWKSTLKPNDMLMKFRSEAIPEFIDSLFLYYGYYVDKDCKQTYRWIDIKGMSVNKLAQMFHKPESV